MGHLVGKDQYRKLGRKIDNLTTHAPWNDSFYKILKELYTPREAELVIKMPYGISDLPAIVRATGFEQVEVEKLLDGLCEKGLIMDFWAGKGYHYTIAPLVIGIFEFTMMRTRGELKTKEWAELFHDYLQGSDAFYRANFGKGQTLSPLRVLPYTETIENNDFVEILDYEKAEAIIDANTKFAIGLCSCRHEKMHLGEKQCKVPLETCSTFGSGIDFLVRHGMAKQVSKEAMRENLARSRELGLVLCADNVQKQVSFICHCCGCCCNVLLGITRFGFPNTVVTSNYIARIDEQECQQCETCVESCPVGAIKADGNGGSPAVNEKLCLGCGVCALSCATDSLKLVPREKRVFYPMDTFEKVILQSLEQGTLQNLIFSRTQNITHSFMRGLVGGFLKLPPVKRSLMSDTFRSRFLSAMRKGG